MKLRITYLLLIFVQLQLFSQDGHNNEKYFPETDPVVKEKIDQWQDIKFGLLMHWGPYSQWGIVESWSLCPEEYGWCKRVAGSNPNDYSAYKLEYEELKKSFNPVNFNPDKWAKAAKNAGMRYVVFTTKHHDGFCMFDSEYTDYKVTDTDCMFSENNKSNITKEIFRSFRNEGLWTGVYFSKPDWHSPHYWDPVYPPRDRNVNYEPEANPEKWNNFIDFTHNQIMELLTNYGKVDILWLDGGWVSIQSKDDIDTWYKKQLENNSNGYLKHRIVNQDIRMDELVKKARKAQPGLIVVDRAVPGINQNYLTPENHVPENPLPFPWESCIISGGGWSHTKNAKYMSGYKGIQSLVDIVAKGGNLLLNIAPTPEGEWQQGAYKLLEEFGKWMSVNSEGIYETNAVLPAKVDNICITSGKNGNFFFFYLCEEDEKIMPDKIKISSQQPADNAVVTILGYDSPVKWKLTEDGFVVDVPKSVRNNPPCKYVWTIKVSETKNKNQ
jgi:alpha-L-fucosidase